MWIILAETFEGLENVLGEAKKVWDMCALLFLLCIILVTWGFKLQQSEYQSEKVVIKNKKNL